MKKHFLIAIALFFCIRAYAQIETPVKWSYAPQTLNCTEEAVSLKANIRSGFRLNSFRVGNVSAVKTSFEPARSSFYPAKDITVTPVPLSQFKNAFSANFEKESFYRRYVTLKFPKVIDEAGKLRYIAYGDKKFVPSTANDFIISLGK
jgi:thiol:disulfide interchange protein DsbD